MMDDSIILVREKKDVERKYYACWPGDEAFDGISIVEQDSKPPAFSLYSKKPIDSNFVNHHKYRDYQPKTHSTSNHDDKRPDSMRNRYFSIENKIDGKIRNEDFSIDGEILKEDLVIEGKKEETPTENPAFIQKRDYLLKKLLKSQTLPGLDETPAAADANLNDLNSKPVIVEPKPLRKSSFHDEYIPLFGANSTATKRTKPDSSDEESDIEAAKDYSSSSSSSDDDIKIVKEKKYNPELKNLDKYRGPYPLNCLYRGRRVLIEEFRPHSNATNRSNYFDRRFEILKMKLDITSKFDKDNRLWNKIKRETFQVKQQIIDKMNARDRRFNYFKSRNNNNTKKQKIVFKSSDEEEDILFFDDDSATYKTKKAKKSPPQNNHIKSINLDTDSTSNCDSNEENVINMINQTEYNLNESATDEDDSKCKQFGKYATKSKQITKNTKTKQKNLKTENLPKRKQSKANKPSKEENALEDNECMRFDRTGLVANDEYDELKLRYKNIRNKRNKVLRKKKGVDIEIERKIMSDELKSIRLALKKLRRKKKFTLDRERMEAYNPLDMVRNKDSKKPKKKKNKLTNKKFNREFKKSAKKTNKNHSGRYFENFN